MAQLMEYADYLSKEIGPRPAGTEEEQQAALYITEQFQKDSGISAQIEEFTNSTSIETSAAIPGVVIILVAILSTIFPVLAIPAFILGAAAAALYVLEAFGQPIVTRALGHGASQNVVARYQPSGDAGVSSRGRSRKIILMARYDSDKVTPGLVRTVESLRLPVTVGMLCVIAIAAAALLLLLRVFFNAGIPFIIINILLVIVLIVCAYPILRAILYRSAPYNEGANNNASGAAALLEVARRISRGSVSEADLAELGDEVVIHGPAAAAESGYVPEGAQIVYEAEQLTPPAEIGEYDEEERLIAAKAAIAAMTGQPVERKVYGSVADKLVNSRAKAEPVEFEVADGRSAEPQAGGHPAEPQAGGEFVEYAQAPRSGEGAFAMAGEAPVVAMSAEQPAPAEVAPAVAPEAEPSQTGSFSNAPSWFVTAQRQAVVPEQSAPVQRSRYAEAIEAAQREAAARENERMEQERLRQEAELRARGEAARAAFSAAAPVAQPSLEDEGSAPVAGVVAAPVEQPPIDDFAAASSGQPPLENLEAIPVPEPATEQDAKPAADEFSASLGSTVAFKPEQLHAYGMFQAEEEPHQEGPLASLPAIEGVEPPARRVPESVEQGVPETTSPSRSGLFRMLRNDVPSMSGVIRMQEAGQDVSQMPPVAPAPQPVGSAPQPAKPVSAEPAALPVVEPAPAAAALAPQPAAPVPADRHPEPARDGAVDYDMRPSEFAGYEEVYGEYLDDGRDDHAVAEVPKTRAGGLLGRFRKKKDRERLEETPQEWLDVDRDFDARTVGRERGGWESFRQDDFADDEPRSGDKWNGGAYSRVRLGHVDTRSGEGTDVGEPDAPVADEVDRQIADEIEQIYHFRNPQYNTEIWFVALGSEGAAHDGVKAFLAEHHDDLRGSMIIEVESLGAGELCAATAEGRVRPIEASSRVKRYLRTASAATGITPGTVDLSGSDSAVSVLQAAGYQTMHLLGVEDGQPALKGSPDDVMENIDEVLFDDNVNFLMEVLKK